MASIGIGTSGDSQELAFGLATQLKRASALEQIRTLLCFTMPILNLPNGAVNTAGVNRRVAVRHKTLKAVKLVASTAWVFVDGILRDISDTGARIECKNCNMVQDEFRLIVVVDGTIRPCKIIWRKLNTMGVEFTGPAQAAPPRKF